ncbi:MAG: DUF853 family protein [Clostridia bacterium]|nr:DUF853 family protein [Clostridia bacterium]
MYLDNKIYIGLTDDTKERVCMPLSIANRHGLITGASGTGKTITMKVLAESFSDAGVPVFVCDIKGDVAGLCAPGVQNEGMEKRIDKFGIRDSFQYKAYPVTFWDVYGEHGHPIRATVSDMGPELISRILGLTPAQEGVLHILFKLADDKGVYLDDLKDLRMLIDYALEHRQDLSITYGNMAAATIGAIQRALLPLESQGADLFFGKPDLQILDLMRTTYDGKGMINILHSVRLVQNPTLYATFLLWLMAELFEELPEVGDLAKPKLVFFFDEAHLLFTDAPKVLVQKIEQLVKLIRSKGVGIYFVSQSPSDIPDAVLAQLSNRVQHALRAYTPAEQKNIRAAAQSLRENPAFDTQEMIMQLGVGHALMSFLDEEGVPQIVQNCSVLCPQSLMAEPDISFFNNAMNSDFMSKYDMLNDRESAYEVLGRQKQAELEVKAREEEEKLREAEEKKKAKEEEKAQAKKEKDSKRVKNKIESQLISTGGYLFRRGLLSTLKKLF